MSGLWRFGKGYEAEKNNFDRGDFADCDIFRRSEYMLGEYVRFTFL